MYWKDRYAVIKFRYKNIGMTFATKASYVISCLVYVFLINKMGIIIYFLK